MFPRRRRLFVALLLAAVGVVWCWQQIYNKHPVRFEFWNETPAGLPVFMFHENDLAELDSLFGHLARNQYTTLGLSEFLDVVEGRRSRGPRDVVLTFDDGKLALWRVTFPKFQQYGLKGIAFVNPGLVVDDPPRGQDIEKPLTREDLRTYCSWAELKLMQEAGLDIQSHSMCHNRQLFSSKQRHENYREGVLISLQESRRILLERGFGPQKFFCAPFGVVSESLLQIAVECGYGHVIGVGPLEGVEGFFGPENSFPGQRFILRLNFRAILSLPGEGRLSFPDRLFHRLRHGGNRSPGYGA